MPQIVDLLNRFHECVILIRGVVTQHVHVEAHALLDERKSDATGANHRDRFAGDFVSEEWQVRMPISPLQIAGEMLRSPEFTGERSHHEEGKLGSRFGQHIGGISERDLVAICVGAIDVVEADSELSNDLQRSLPCLEDFGVDRIAKRRDEPIDARLHFVYDQALRRGLGVGIDFNVVSSFAEQVDGFSDVAGGKHTKFLIHKK